MATALVDRKLQQQIAKCFQKFQSRKSVRNNVHCIEIKIAEVESLLQRHLWNAEFFW